MVYNVKIADYEGVLNASFYETRIQRKDEAGEEENENDKKAVKRRQSDTKHNIQSTWHNPETGKVEIIPEGFRPELDPFTMTTTLVPLPEYMPHDVFMTDEELREYVAKQVEEDRKQADARCKYSSLTRAKKNIYEISKANKWDLFVTITVADQDRRYDLDEVKKMVHKKINKLRERKNLTFGYLLIPEQHKDGAWHLHGLFNDIDGLTITKARSAKTNRLLKTKNGKQVYNIQEFVSIGHNTVTYVEDTVAVAKYITKYITKDMEWHYPNKRKYLCSKGLNRATVTYQEIEDIEHLYELLERIIGYVPEKVFEKETVNPYTQTSIKYMEFKK